MAASKKPKKSKKASKVLLMISGGPDSATLAKVVASTTGGAQIHGVYLRSGHPSDDKEIEAASKILEGVGGRLEIIDISKTVSALGGKRVMIHSEASLLPLGNALALSIASAYAVQIGAESLWLGLHRDDADENAEYTQEFLDRFNELVEVGQSVQTLVRAPFLGLRKHEVFARGLRLRVDYASTWSCIRAGDSHCGDCGACRARRRAFDLAGATDPTDYAMEPAALATAASH